MKRGSGDGSVDERYVPHHGDPSYTVTRYDLVVDYVPESNRLTGTATLGDYSKAAAFYRVALAGAPTQPERDFFARRLDEVGG